MGRKKRNSTDMTLVDHLNQRTEVRGPIYSSHISSTMIFGDSSDVCEKQDAKISTRMNYGEL